MLCVLYKKMFCYYIYCICNFMLLEHSGISCFCVDIRYILDEKPKTCSI